MSEQPKPPPYPEKYYERRLRFGVVRFQRKGASVLDAQQSVWALENGTGLRAWVEEAISGIQVHYIRCATFAVGVPGLLWLVKLASQYNAKLQLLSDDGQTDPDIAPYQLRELIQSGFAEWRSVPVRPGASLNREGWFHPKVLLFDDRVAVVGSANLTGCALGIGVPPHHVEISIGLCGPAAQAAIDVLLKTFEIWWQNSKPVDLSMPVEESQNGGDTMMNHTPEYVIFRKRPAWGIAQVQTAGGGMFGQERWLAISDISPSDPTIRLPAHIQVPQQMIENQEPVLWLTPAAQLAAIGLPSAGNARDHFRRLCAYWLQAENRQGQLDSVPVLSLRHQASLVEYLTRPGTPPRMLIGDEVGLGKTIEVGLLIERLQSANPDLRILYITLGNLVPNVADEFGNMGLDGFYVYGNVQLDEQRYQPARLGNDEHDRRVVASLHRLGFGDNWERKLRDTEWDVVIADECHRLRMYGAGEDTHAQKWFRVIERVLTQHLARNGRAYFLSGTPHQGNREVFLNMAGLLCGLPRTASEREKQRALSGRIIYRIKEEICDWDNLPLFPKRDIREPTYATTPDEYNDLLTEIAGYYDWLLSYGGQRAIGFVKSSALQYAASSPKAGFAYLFRRYLRNFAEEGSQAKMKEWVDLLVPYRNRPLERPEKLLAYLIERVRAEEDADADEDDAGDLTDFVGPLTRGELHNEERKRLTELLDKYARLLRHPQSRAKFEELGRLLNETDEPFVVFAQSVDTVYEIKRFLKECGIPCNLIVGGQDPAERKREMQEFLKPGPVGRRVLVSSSAGGEGINLQVARRLIHFDLPWNPMVLEQRIGRVHRIGSINTIIVHTILLKGSREADIYLRLIERLNTIVSALATDSQRRAEYFRRILAGIPLETLRALFSGQGDNDAIARAVEEGKQAVEQVDTELRERRVQEQELTEDRGRATMERLVQLLEEANTIKALPQTVSYTQLKYDADTELFICEEKKCPRYEINHGKGNWVVFDREAAAKSPEVQREQTGGINHPLIAVGLRNLRTPRDIEDMPNLTIGVGTYDRECLQLLSNGEQEPVVILTYLIAHLNGEQFFNHRLRVFTLSPSRREPEAMTSDGDIEDIFWSQLGKDLTATAAPKLSDEFLRHVATQDSLLRKKMEAEVKDEQGHRQGAVWPISVTILIAGD